jgi:pyridoxamine 5'-phosphate oxidase-like protein
VPSWAEFEAAQPEFAARVRKLMSSRKHLTMATLRSDGSPRISGTEVQFAGGQLRIGSMPNAVKARDLLRDGRVAIHGPTTDPPEEEPGLWVGEAKVAGRAIALPSEDGNHSFAIDVDEAVITSLGDGRLVVESWNPRRGYQKFARD